MEAPSIAIELATRFPFPRLHAQIRWLLLNVPGKAIDEPGAVSLLLGGMLPDDVNFLQLKVYPPRPLPTRLSRLVLIL